MRKYGGLVAAILLVLLTACAVKALSLQGSINEGKEAVLATKGLILQNLKDGFYTADKAESMLNSAEKVEADLKKAEDLLALGKDLALAQTQAATARAALRALRTQVEERR